MNRIPSAALAALCAACTASTTADPATPDAGPTNTAPAWRGVTTLEVGEGTSARVPLNVEDAQEDPVSVSVAAPPGLTATVANGNLTVAAGYGATSGDVVLTLTDDKAASSTATLVVTVKPLRWSPRTTWSGAEGPEAREHPAVLTDDATGSIYVMFGSGYSPYGELFGDAWRFDTATGDWTACAMMGDVPPAAGSRRIAGRRGQPEGLLYGGYRADQEPVGDLVRVVAAGNTLTFTNVPQQGGPMPRFLHLWTHDPVSGRFVVFGGAGGTVLADTWVMTLQQGTAVWDRVTGGLAPSARFGGFFGTDESSGRVYLFSGQQGVGTFADDVWVLDARAEPPFWDIVPELVSTPPGRRNGSYVMDPTGPRLWVFGGTFDGMTSAPGLWALNAVPGSSRFDEVVLADPPPMRSSGIAVAINGAVWIGFGNDRSVYADMTRLGP